MVGAHTSIQRVKICSFYWTDSTSFRFQRTQVAPGMMASMTTQSMVEYMRMGNRRVLKSGKGPRVTRQIADRIMLMTEPKIITPCGIQTNQG